MDGVGDGGSDADDGAFAGAYGGEIFAVDEDGFKLRHVLEARDAILGEMGIEDAAIFELDCLEQRTADAHNVCALYLIAESIGIDDRPAFECRYDPI